MTTGPTSPDQPNEPASGEQPPAMEQQPPPPPGYAPPPPVGQTPVGQMPGYPMQPQQPQPLRPDEEKLWAIGAHLGPLVLGLIAPLIVWLVFKDRSAFLDRHGKEALNMQISYLIYGLVSGFSIILIVGIVLLPAVMIAWLVLMIIATIKAANHEDYRYPLIFRFVN